MSPSETAAHYDQIAAYWRDQVPATYGLAALEKAAGFVTKMAHSLDVGCGSQGRFIEWLNQKGYQVEGLDASLSMVTLARERHPSVTFYHADIVEWPMPAQRYALITAWDSTFHLPLAAQEPVLRKLCSGLAPGGILLFTCGGGDPGEITGSFAGQDFGYSTLGPEIYVALLHSAGCRVLHLDYDQYPEQHVIIIAQKPPLPSPAQAA